VEHNYKLDVKIIMSVGKKSILMELTYWIWLLMMRKVTKYLCLVWASNLINRRGYCTVLYCGLLIVRISSFTKLKNSLQ